MRKNYLCYKEKLLIVMCKVHKSELPDDIIKLFDRTSSHGYDLRKSIKLAVSRFNLDAGRTSLRSRGPFSCMELYSRYPKAGPEFKYF